MATTKEAEPSLREKHVAAIEAGGSVLWHDTNDGRPITTLDDLPSEAEYALKSGDEEAKAKAEDRAQAKIAKLQAEVASLRAENEARSTSPAPTPEETPLTEEKPKKS